MYVNESIPVKQLNSHKDDSETLFLESNLRLVVKMADSRSIKTSRPKQICILEGLSKIMSIYLEKYEILLDIIKQYTHPHSPPSTPTHLHLPIPTQNIFLSTLTHPEYYPTHPQLTPTHSK